MTDKVSVIVPCYQGERHIGNMLHDLCSQTYANLEILVVGNGPNQAAQRAVVEDLANKDSRVRYLSLKDAGVSRARNAGIDAATGAWIAFVDDDDRVPEDWMARFAVHFREMPDMIAGGISCLGQGEKAPRSDDLSVKATGVFSNDPKEFLKIFSSDTAVRYSPCSKVISRAFLNENGLRFDPALSVCEDCVFSQQVALKCRAMAFIPQTGYLYVSRRGSAAGRYHADMVEALEKRRALLVEVARKSGQEGQSLVSFADNQLIADTLDVFLNSLREHSPYGFGDKVKLLKNLYADNAFQKACQTCAADRSNKPLVLFLYFYRLRAARTCVTVFRLLFFLRDLARRVR